MPLPSVYDGVISHCWRCECVSRSMQCQCGAGGCEDLSLSQDDVFCKSVGAVLSTFVPVCMCLCTWQTPGLSVLIITL